MTKSTIKSRPSIRRLSSGLTVVELLVAVVVGLIVIGAAFAVAVSSRDLLQADQARTSANQNLRGALDIIGTDVRIAGERLTGRGAPSIAAVVINNGKELTLRRNILEEALPVCEDTSGGNPVTVSLIPPNPTISVYPQCDNSGPRNKNVDEMPDDLEVWKKHREDNGDSVLAYIFANARGGEFFTYNAESSSGAGYSVQRSGGSWGKSYKVSEETNLYILDERRYRLRDSVLELIVNGDEGEDDILKVVNNVTDFQVRAVMRDGTEVTNLSNTNTTREDWKSVSAIRVTLSVDGRTLTSEFFPRNIFSN